MRKMERREFLAYGMSSLVFIPLTGIAACSSGKAPVRSPEESLKKLILILGPWKKADKAFAEDYMQGFMQTESVLGKYLPASGKIIQDLARHFDDENPETAEIRLDRLSSDERAVLLDLTKEIYNFVDVQLYAAHMPAWGQCIGDPLWHTKAPV